MDLHASRMVNPGRPFDRVAVVLEEVTGGLLWRKDGSTADGSCPTGAFLFSATLPKSVELASSSNSHT